MMWSGRRREILKNGYLSPNYKQKNAFCKWCLCEIRSHKGDLKRYADSDKHILAGRTKQTHTSASEYAYKKDTLNKAELIWTSFLLKNDLPFSLSEKCSSQSLFPSMFPDSIILRT
jgi:hypothetical protein